MTEMLQIMCFESQVLESLPFLQCHSLYTINSKMLRRCCPFDMTVHFMFPVVPTGVSFAAAYPCSGKASPFSCYVNVATSLQLFFLDNIKRVAP
jgi:hypothetical protein